MVKKLKIGIIGAGSSTFSVSFIKDICCTPNFEGCTVCFMDVNESRLQTIVSFCERYIKEIGFNLNILATTDNRECIRNADFVVDLALVVGHDGYWRGWEVASKYNYRYGGSYHVMHDEAFWVNYYQLKHFDEIVNLILELAPNSWLLLLANPVLAATTYLARKYKSLKFVGLCHGYSGIYHIAKILGLEREHIKFQMSGVNHFLWLTDFTCKGKNAFPILDKWIADGSAEKYWETNPGFNLLGPTVVDQYKRHGALPIGDTCSSGGGSWPFWYHTDDETEALWREKPKKEWYNRRKNAGEWESNLKKAIDDKAKKLTDIYPAQMTDEIILPLMESISCDIPREIYVNILNDKTYISGISNDFEVEIPAIVSKKGIQGIHPTPLPKSVLTYLLRDRIAPVETELMAYETHSRQRLVELIMMDPWTKSEKQAQNLLQDILGMEGCEQMRQYYK
jgi:alpha-galactosidase